MKSHENDGWRQIKLELYAGVLLRWPAGNKKGHRPWQLVGMLRGPRKVMNADGKAWDFRMGIPQHCLLKMYAVLEMENFIFFLSE